MGLLCEVADHGAIVRKGEVKPGKRCTKVSFAAASPLKQMKIWQLQKGTNGEILRLSPWIPQLRIPVLKAPFWSPITAQLLPPAIKATTTTRTISEFHLQGTSIGNNSREAHYLLGMFWYFYAFWREERNRNIEAVSNVPGLRALESRKHTLCMCFHMAHGSQKSSTWPGRSSTEAVVLN